jgi:ABC-type lipoprotein release transport system permease subunit
MFEPSKGEAIVGRGVEGRYVGAQLGQVLHFGRNRWNVVGVFESQGSAFESEVWVDTRELAADAKRTIPYSGLRVRVADGADRDALARRIGADSRWALEATPEPEYYAKQAESANSLFFIVVGLAVLAGIGATFGATNTLYAAVQSRRAEIGTLRALGFRRSSILAAFLAESLLLALVGGVAGLLLASFLQAFTITTMNWQSFSQLAFGFHLTPAIAAQTLAFSLFMGLVGGFLPSVRAARLEIVDSLRAA